MKQFLPISLNIQLLVILCNILVMNIEINIYSIRKRFEECVREESVHLATLKSKKIYKLIAFLKTLQRLEQELQVSPALDQANRWQKLGVSPGILL